jgi:hypothetical protein
MDAGVSMILAAAAKITVCTWGVFALLWILAMSAELKRKAHLYESERERSGMYWKMFLETKKELLGTKKERDEWIKICAGHEQKIRNLEYAVEMEQKNLSLAQEHMRYYIETVADMETLVQIKDEELESRERRAESRDGSAVARGPVERALRWCLDEKMREVGRLRAELAAERAKGQKGKRAKGADAQAEPPIEELDEEYLEIRASEAPVFGQGATEAAEQESAASIEAGEAEGLDSRIRGNDWQVDLGEFSRGNAGEGGECLGEAQAGGDGPF